MNRAAFYDSLRRKVNLTTQNVAGMEKVLDYAEEHRTPLRWLAYIIATAWWETAQTMHPVREAYWKSDQWRARNLRYYPWYGRGLIQTTWKANYKKMGQEIGMDLLADPDRLLEWDAALPALFVGMEKGIYTGKDLDDYIPLDGDPDYRNARRIVNGTDRAQAIADLADHLEGALEAAHYAIGQPDDPGVEPKPPPLDIMSILRLIANRLRAVFSWRRR